MDRQPTNQDWEGIQAGDNDSHHIDRWPSAPLTIRRAEGAGVLPHSMGYDDGSDSEPSSLQPPPTRLSMMLQERRRRCYQACRRRGLSYPDASLLPSAATNQPVDSLTTRLGRQSLSPIHQAGHAGHQGSEADQPQSSSHTEGHIDADNSRSSEDMECDPPTEDAQAGPIIPSTHPIHQYHHRNPIFSLPQSPILPDPDASSSAWPTSSTTSTNRHFTPSSDQRDTTALTSTYNHNHTQNLYPRGRHGNIYSEPNTVTIDGQLAAHREQTTLDEGQSNIMRAFPRSRRNTISPSLEMLGAYRENGLLRVRSGAAAAAAGGKVLVHNVPRMRKRRQKKLEMRQGTGESADPSVGTILSHQSSSPAAISV